MIESFKTIPLWNNDVPESIGRGTLHEPHITVHLPPLEAANGCGVLVAPGGGYRILASDHEGLQVARAFNRRGIAAFVLKYRVGTAYSSRVSLLDGQRAIRLIRHHSNKFGTSKLGMLGFSAGGHITAAVGTAPPYLESNTGDSIDQESARPDFLVLVYAVTNGIVRGRKADEYTPPDTKVNYNTPPTFLLLTHEDSIVPPEQSQIFYNELHKHRIPAEMHIFGRGEHGIGLGTGDPNSVVWFELLNNWIRRLGFLTQKKRLSVSGRLTLNAKDPGYVWLTFEPTDVNAPPAVARFDQLAGGKFEIGADRGPTEGVHTVTVRHISNKHPQDATGLYTLEDERIYQDKIEVLPNEPMVIRLNESHRIV
ncbi:MAG: alpha/beta hydrolase [Gammaproteobacteria bacterium]|nr:alpha/beta hydrolase [Gammaproteobacteria bacterium]